MEWVEAITLIRAPRWRKLPLDVLAFELWWRGFPADIGRVRTYLVAELGRRLGGLAGKQTRSADASEIADLMVKELRKHPNSRHPVVKLMLRRVGGKLDTVAYGLYALVLFFFGEEPEWDAGDAEDVPDPAPPVRDALIQLFGFDRAASDTAPDGTRLLDEPIDLRPMLVELRELTGGDVRRLWLPLVSVAEPELEQARVDAVPFARAMPVMTRALEHLYARDFAGFGIFRAVFRTQERYFRILALLAMLILRPRYAEGIEELDQALAAEENRFRAYLAIIDALPEYRTFMRLDQEDAIAKLPDDLRTRMRDDVQAFLDDHPDLSEALFG